MAIALADIWKIEQPKEYKVHFARWNGKNEPLEVFVRDRREWQRWQEYRPSKDDFNRTYIFSLAKFYHETDIWIFGGLFRVVARTEKRYEVSLLDVGKGFIGRLKLYSPHRGRTTRAKLEKHYDSFVVSEILSEPYSGRQFTGYENIDLSFGELETLIKNDRLDWKAALENAKGIYLISDTSTGKRYVGAASGAQGIWSRWRHYVKSGHGGNVELRSLLTGNELSKSKDSNLAYYRSNFRFTLLEHRSNLVPDEVIRERETFWKKVLLTRGPDGLNRN